MTEPRRLLRLITRLNVGGPARQANLLTRSLEPAWHTRLCAGTPSAEEGELLDDDVTVHRIPLTRPIRPAEDLAAFRAVRSLLGQDRPHLVHTHMAKAGTIGRLAVRSVRDRPKTVHTFHGHVLDGYFRPAVQSAFIRAERALARRTDLLVAVSEETRDSLLDLGIGRPDQYRVIGLGLPLERHLAVTGPSGVLRDRLGLGPDVPLVGMVGRLVPIKDPETAIAAIAAVPDAHLVLLGDGERRAAVEASVRAAGLGDRVHLLGWWADVPAAMADLDVVLLTSRNEGTPVSLIEAGACARPVVATDVGGVRRVVDDGVTGHLLPAGDVAGLAAALRGVLADPARAGGPEGGGRRHVADRFAASRLVADIAALYDELVPPR